MKREELIDKINNNESILPYDESSEECISLANAYDGMKQLRELAKDCKSLDDYCRFFKNVLKMDVEIDNGLILRLHKKECTCPLAHLLKNGKEKMCECTRLHEIKTWSVFFDKKIDIELIETINRGDSDCIIKIISI